MLKLDNSLLDELGLGTLPEEQKRAMLQHIYETLELRVGTNLANQMTDQQLEEFEKFIDEGGDANQAQALQWLESNLPNYKQVVNDVFEQLKVEIKQMAPQLMAASGAAPATPAAQQSYAQPQPPVPSPNDYYGQPVSNQPAPAAPYVPPAPQPAPQSGMGGPGNFGAPAAAPGFGAQPVQTPPTNDFMTPDPLTPPPSFASPAPQTASGGPGGFGPAPSDSSTPASQPSVPAGFTPLPADPIAGGQQQVVQPAPTPYDQPSMPLPGTPAGSQMPSQDPQQQAPQPSQDNPGQGGYQFPTQQPPAGPGNYPPQHPGR